MSDFCSKFMRVFSCLVTQVLVLTFLFSANTMAQSERNRKVSLSVNTITFPKQKEKKTAGEVIGKIAEALVTGQINVQRPGSQEAVRAAIVNGISHSHRTIAFDGAPDAEGSSSDAEYYVDVTIPNIATATKTEISSDKKYTTVYYKATVSAVLHIKDSKTNAIVYSQTFNISDLDFSWFTSSEEALVKSLGVLSKRITRYFNSILPLTANIIEGARDKKDKQKEVYIDLGESEGAYRNLHFGVFTVKTVAGKEARKQIGKLKITDVQGDDISLCKVQSGGKEIKSAIDAGENILVMSID